MQPEEMPGPPATQPEAEDADGMPQLPQAFEGGNSPLRESSDDSLLVSGVARVESEHTLTVPGEPDALQLRPPADTRFAWAIYSFEASETERPVRLELDVSAAASLPSEPERPLEYYAAVSDYTRGAWRFYGPFTDDASIELNSESERQRLVGADFRTHVAVLVAGAGREGGPAAAVVQTLLLQRLGTGSSNLYPTKPAQADIVTSITGMAARLALPAVTEDELGSAAQHVLVEAVTVLGPPLRQLIFNAAVPEPAGEVQTFELPFPMTFQVSTVYRYEVRLTNAQGSAALLSSQPFVVPEPLVAVPWDLTASYKEFGSRIELSWTGVPEASGYLLYRDDVNTPLVELGEVTSYSDESVSYGEDHTYYVRARSATRLSAFSQPAIGRRELLPAHSLRASYQHFDDEIRLTWLHPAFEAGQSVNFQIYRRKASGGSAQKVTTVTDVLEYIDDMDGDADEFEYYIVAHQPKALSVPSEMVVGRARIPGSSFGVRMLEFGGLAPAEHLSFEGTFAAPMWDLRVTVEISEEMAPGATLAFDLNSIEPVDGSNFDEDIVMSGFFEPGVHVLTFAITDGDISGGFSPPSANILGIRAMSSEGPEYASAFYPLLLEIPEETE